MKIYDEIIYAWIKQDKNVGGEWYKELRQSSRKRRKRYGSGTSKRDKIKTMNSVLQGQIN